MHDRSWCFVHGLLLFLFQVLLPSVVTKIVIGRVKPIHISRIATLCVNEFFDPQTTSQSSYKRERLWICQHLESKSTSPRSFFVAQYVNETSSDEKETPVVGFVEIAMSSDYNQLLSKHCESLSSTRLSFCEQRPKITALVVDRQYRRLGIGRLLMTACALQSRKWTGHDAEEMFLDVAKDNTVAQCFYRSLGFVACSLSSNTPSSSSAGEPGNVNHRSHSQANQAKASAAEQMIIMYRGRAIISDC